ncbi:MAG: transhydrogenase alpha subunit, partial [Burkholderia sp.]|nr:transhydrogenase alpha subunit [Burkholderia sp.]
MRIGIPAETRPGETRVAATPETVKKLVTAGHQVVVQAQAGVSSSITDEAFTAAGAQIGSAADALGADMVLKVRAPGPGELAMMRPGTVLIGMLNHFDTENIAVMAQH